jgi:hypothetical protein
MHLWEDTDGMDMGTTNGRTGGWLGCILGKLTQT